MKVINLAYELTASTGRTILVGVPPVNEKITIYSLPLHFDKTIKGSFGGESNPSVDIPNYIRLYKNKVFDPKKTISHRYTLDQINEAIEDMHNGKIIRCMIRMGS